MLRNLKKSVKRTRRVAYEKRNGGKPMNTKRILKQLIEDLDLAIIKAKAQLEYMEDEE